MTKDDDLCEWLRELAESSKKDAHPSKRFALMRMAMTDSCSLGGLSGDHWHEYREERALPLFSMARAGDVDADAALCIIAALHLYDGKTLPPLLAIYVAGILRGRATIKPRRRRGANPYANVERDLFIISAVAMWRDELGLYATRNEASKDKQSSVSACANVARALGMKERAVEEIWAKRREFGRK
jgi:hypothetical protein